MPALDAALALADDQRSARPVSDHLHLDVVGVDDDLLQVETAVAEGGLGLRRGRRVGRFELGRLSDGAHAAPAAARGGLEQHRVTDLSRHPPGLLHPAQAALRPGHERHPGGAHAPLASDLSPRTSIDSAVGPMKIRSFSSQARTNDGLSERKP